jgi:hypothetical protein
MPISTIPAKYLNQYNGNNNLTSRRFEVGTDEPTCPFGHAVSNDIYISSGKPNNCGGRLDLHHDDDKQEETWQGVGLLILF